MLLCCSEIQKHTSTPNKKAQNAESAKEDGGLRTTPPPLLRARVPFFFFLSISSVLLPVFARAGESFGKQKQRERRGVEREAASVRFFSSVFFCFSLSLSLSPSLSLLPCCCFVFSSRLTKQQQQLSSPHKKSKSASRARV